MLHESAALLASPAIRHRVCFSGFELSFELSASSGRLRQPPWPQLPKALACCYLHLPLSSPSLSAGVSPPLSRWASGPAPSSLQPSLALLIHVRPRPLGHACFQQTISEGLVVVLLQMLSRINSRLLRTAPVLLLLLLHWSFEQTRLRGPQGMLKFLPSPFGCRPPAWRGCRPPSCA